MTTNPIPIIELNQTDSKKRGQLYGEAARERIHAILDKYHEIFQRITGKTWEKTVEEHVLWPQNEFFVHTNHYLKQGKNFPQCWVTYFTYNMISSICRFAKTCRQSS